ncbi:hypothetical protein GJAV_G00057180 [Gymnothorax javanicus]|nr:hypothetical protein GJAV_G00057180 [Gymnothorax javanicus]
MAIARQHVLFILISTQCYVTTFAVTLKSLDKSPWVNELESVELSCLIESISTNNPRIEWKKIKDGVPSYVYFEKKGDLENRAQLMEPATLVITNATRGDTAQYRCEVTAVHDQKSFDEILINLIVRVKPVVPRCSVPQSVPVGKTAELSCVEEEGFPSPQYSWFRNDEEVPEDPKNSAKFFNSSYTLDPNTGTLTFSAVRKEDEGEYYCRAKNDAGYSDCGPHMMEVYDLNIVAIVAGVAAVVFVLLCIMVGICCAYKRGFFPSKKETGSDFRSPERGDGVDYVRTDQEGDFRHKSSFVI